MHVSSTTRIAATWAVAVLFASLLWTPASAADVAVRLELSQQFYYEGDPLDVRISVLNQVGAKIDNPIQTGLLEGFVAKQGDRKLERSAEVSAEEPSRPGKLAADSFYGATVDLVELYPELAGHGTYEIYWSGDGILSEMLVVTVIPRFDPTREYLAEIETDQGTIVIELIAKGSPIAVKSFIDLAHSHYYDGLEISEVRPDSYIVAGDPRFGNEPRQPIQFPAEPSSLPLVTGTVVLRPARATPPANGSTFVVLLRPQPSWTGQVTVLGQVVDGLDVVQKFSRAPSSLRNSQPNFKPLQAITIRSVTIREKTAKQPGS